MSVRYFCDSCGRDFGLGGECVWLCYGDRVPAASGGDYDVARDRLRCGVGGSSAQLCIDCIDRVIFTLKNPDKPVFPMFPPAARQDLT